MRARLHGGGFIFYSRSPTTGQIFVLLGRERADNQWKYVRRQWSAFAGCASSDEDARAVCSREATEEIMGLNVLRPEGTEWLQRHDLHTVIDSRDYGALISVFMEPYGSQEMKRIHARKTRKMHCTVVKEIPWCPDIGQRFQDCRRQLLTLQKADKMYRHRISLLHPHEQTLVPGIHLAIQVMRNYMIDDMMVTSGTNILTNKPWRLIFHPSGRFLRTHRAYQTLVQVLKHTPMPTRRHPAVTITRVNQTLLGVTVRPDYLEKDKIAWWSIPLLGRVLGNGGEYKGERFRHCFLPTLQICVNMFRPRRRTDQTQIQHVKAEDVQPVIVPLIPLRIPNPSKECGTPYVV